MPYVASGYWTAGYAEGDQVNMDVSWIVFDVLAASLTLTQSARYDNTPDTFYSPTVASVTPLTQASRFDNTSTFFSSTVTTTVSLTQNTRYDNTPDTFYTPTVTPGTITLTQVAFGNHNLIPNSTMQGAIIGTPGAFPTGWNISGLPVSMQIIGTGIDSGYDYIDIRLFGTSASGNVDLYPLSTTDYIPTYGIADDQYNFTFRAVVTSYSGAIPATIRSNIWRGTAPTFGAASSDTSIPLVTGASLSNAGTSLTDYFGVTPEQIVVGTTGMRPAIRFTVPSGTVDFTIRIGAVSVTKSLSPSVYVPTYGTKVDLGDTPDTFFSPTTTVGPVTLTQASRFDNSATFFTHAIGTLILPNRYDNTPDTFYAATVTPGPVTITQVSRFNNTNNFFGATVNLSISQATRYDNTPDTFYSATATPGPVVLTQATRYDNTPDTFYSVNVNLNLTQATRYDNTPDTFYSANINLSLTQATRYDNTPDTFYSATVAQLLSPTRYDNTPDTFYAATVTPGVRALTQATRYDNTPDTFYTPVLKVINDLSGTGTTSTQVNSTGIAQPIYTTDTVQVNSTTVNTISKNTKLGILYKNIGDLATLSSTSTAISGFPLINLQSEHKYKLWRVSGNTASFSMTWTTGQTISAIIFPISNLNSSAIIRVRTYADEAGTAIISDTGNQQPILSTQESVGINNYSHYSNSIARVFVSKVSNIKHCKVDITDTTPQGYIEISRLVCGEIWNPTYGTSYGLSSVFLSDSKHERTEAGNIYTDRKNTYKSISFDLNYLTLEDRQNLLKLINTSGTRNPLFVSIFPNSEDPIKEETYQIYGKIVDSPTLNNPMYSMYSTNLTLESV